MMQGRLPERSPAIRLDPEREALCAAAQGIPRQQDDLSAGRTPGIAAGSAPHPRNARPDFDDGRCREAPEWAGRRGPLNAKIIPDKVGQQPGQGGAAGDHVRVLELELIDRERRLVERRIRQARF
ncbi:hypothetical protein ACLF3G_28205 [Falsiroseomonas sp. HC035]|uniref:hypothetical protein n=1 Tax=Falsiroseomonas sp. HC035 TaxID=3390999 RepID=UPI003D3163FF